MEAFDGRLLDRPVNPLDLTIRPGVVLSRFRAAPLIAFTATKETNYGHGKNG